MTFGKRKIGWGNKKSTKYKSDVDSRDTTRGHDATGVPGAAVGTDVASKRVRPLTLKEKRQSPYKDTSDLVELHALKITFKPDDYDEDEMKLVQGRFVTSEVGEEAQAANEEDAASILVSFNSVVSNETVISRLQQVIEFIEDYGKPRTKVLVPRNIGELFKKTEREAPDEASEAFLICSWWPLGDDDRE